MSKPETQEKRIFTVKRCPECFATLQLSMKVCPECNQKVGDPDKDGLARKPFAWKEYLSAVVAILLLILYVWYFFLKDK